MYCYTAILTGPAYFTMLIHILEDISDKDYLVFMSELVGHHD